MKNIKIGIYCIKNTVNNRFYVGQSNDVYKRWSQHKAALIAGIGNRRLQIDWDEYGENCFDFLILEELPDDKYVLEKRESYYAYTYDVWDKGYNIAKLLDYRNFSDVDINHQKEELLKVFSKNPMGRYSFKSVCEKLCLSKDKLAIVFKNLTVDDMKEYSIYLNLNVEFSYESKYTNIESISWEKHEEFLKSIEDVFLSL